MRHMKAIRLGQINFINALPLSLPYEALAGMPIEKHLLSPTALNQAMLEQRLDISPVSSAFYLRHKSEFTLLDGISISAERPVKSVLLFLPAGFSGLTPETPIAVPDASETSIALMQFVVYRHTQHTPTNNLTVYPVGHGHEVLDQGQPLLAMGDEALTLKTRYADHNFVTVDLAEEWQDEMRLPFVFAVWVAQKSWAAENSETLALVNQLLVAKKKAFQRDITVQQRVLDAARERCPHLPESLLIHYFTDALSYNLDHRQLMALSRFEEILTWLDNDAKSDLGRYRPELPVELLHR
jgi:chorismate dehydratase